ncbi:MAG: hypothetical protein ACI9JT_001904 [Polaribacter sp.]|jgi:hypothetical protein
MNLKRLQMIKIVCAGFSDVSQGFVEIILSANSLLPISQGVEIQTVRILNIIKGSQIDENGINMQ